MWCGVVRFVRFYNNKTTNRTALLFAVWCGAVRLCYFAGSFGAVYAV